MIYRLSGKLQKKIKTVPKESLPANTNPFIDWSAAVFIADRVQYILVSNTASVYSFIVPGRGITNGDRFGDETIRVMRESLKSDGLEHLFEEQILPWTGSAAYSKALNRSVTGTMNELIFIAKYMLMLGENTLDEISHTMNSTIFSYINNLNPVEYIRSLSCIDVG